MLMSFAKWKMMCLPMASTICNSDIRIVIDGEKDELPPLQLHGASIWPERSVVEASKSCFSTTGAT